MGLGVRQLGKWESKSWTIKVDADAVFLPTRLQGWLDNKAGESPHGIYFENCNSVQYGFFGNLEVMSKEATKVLTTYLEDCHAVFAPCAYDGCDWKWGPWGEDFYVQRCLDRLCRQGRGLRPDLGRCMRSRSTRRPEK